MDSIRRQFLMTLLKKTEEKLKNIPSEYQELEQVGPAPGNSWGQHDAMVAGGLCNAANKYPHMNRYSNLYPFDKNRFVLENTGDAPDYINASLMELPGEKREFILTMAPLHPSSFNNKTQTDFGLNSVDSTCGQFWHMVLQSKCKLVIMLCKLEKGYQGCSQYFPEKGQESYGGITVELKEESIESEACIHRQIFLDDKRQQLQDTVQHLQFPLWPNYGIVKNVPQFGEFVLKVNDWWNKMYETSACPLIVHCSGGIGRSGTFTTVLSVYRKIINYVETGDESCLKEVIGAEGALHLVGVVKSMREQRHPWMVEGQAQYALAYSTLMFLIENMLKQ